MGLESYLLPCGVLTLTTRLTCIEVIGTLILQSDIEGIAITGDSLCLERRRRIVSRFAADSHLCVMSQTVLEEEVEFDAILSNLRSHEILNTQTVQIHLFYLEIVDVDTAGSIRGVSRLHLNSYVLTLSAIGIERNYILLVGRRSRRGGSHRHEGRSVGRIGHDTHREGSVIRCTVCSCIKGQALVAQFRHLRQDSILILRVIRRIATIGRIEP